ncbi:MAG: hypothetical protein ACPGSD_05145 [Flavobacteriales bacterium]
MIKYILTFSLVFMVAWSNASAQVTGNDQEIQVNLDDFDSENLSQAERLLIDLLVKNQVKAFEKELKELHDDKTFGKITETEYQKRKEEMTMAVSDKIEKSIAILTAAPEPDYIFEDNIETEDIDFTYKKHSDSTRTVTFSFNSDNSSDSTKREMSKNQVYFSGGIGFANWMNSDFERYDHTDSKLNGSTSLYYYLTLKNSHYFNVKKGKGHKRASIDYGLTFTERFYKFNNTEFSINADENGVSNIADASLTKSVFSQVAFEIPVNLTYRFGKDIYRGVIVTAGVYGGMNLRNRQKIEYSVDGEEYKAKWFGDFNTNRFYAGASAKIGYRGIFLEGKYNFTKLFKSSSSIQVNPYTIGLSFGF